MEHITRRISFPLLLLALLCVFILQCPALASKKSYIVYLGGHSHGAEASQEDYKQAIVSHHEFLGSFLGSKEKAQDAIFYSYTKHINGFAANLDEEEVTEIRRNPKVISVFPNEAYKLHTTRSWHLLGLERHGRIPAMSIWSKAKLGADTIIGNLDTGVWPESKSFSDEEMGPIPSRWKGSCENQTKNGVSCNRKLIGAKHYSLGYEAAMGQPLVAATRSARDTDGHGTHTLSTAAGSLVPGANLLGHANGTAKGGSPNACVAAYKVCWNDGCYSADILAGFDEAIHDGVDVLSVSLGGGESDYLMDPIAIGAFHAMAAGITVVCSCGNLGPIAGAIANTAPWIFTVAASTIDREFPSFLTLGNNKSIKGESLSDKTLPANKFYPLINAKHAKASNSSAYEAELCYSDTLEPKKVKGKIVVCLRGDIARTDKGETVRTAGGVGMIVVNDWISGDSLIADPHLLPATNIAYKDGITLASYMNSTRTPVGQISAPKTQLGVKPAPFIASFSSRGPSLMTPQILKPDITAPGVSVLAAFTEAVGPTAMNYDTRRVEFNIMSGTSMSCPHVAGIVGLLRTLHPDWSPSAIRSAIMTSARTRDNTGKPIKDYSMSKATALMYGSGHVHPNRAMDPGLVYDLKTDNYLDFLCALGYNSSQLTTFIKKPYKCPSKRMKLEDLNYPSIAVPDLAGSRTVTRTLKNVGSPGTYKVRVQPPFGISVSVDPQVLKFAKVGEEKSFKVTLKSKKVSVGVGYVFGRLIWSDGKHYVRSPVVVNAMS